MSQSLHDGRMVRAKVDKDMANPSLQHVSDSVEYLLLVRLKQASG